MMPAYRSMDSYPHQRSQIPFPHCYYPGMEAIPPQLRMDISKSPFPYEQPWPYTGSYGYPTPMHFCCGHNNFPCYYSCRPAYPHAAAPPMHYSGGCSGYGEPFSVPYSPQPHYTMELPRYEYDKFMRRDYHCCGCPNHPCHQKEGKGVQIEEEEPDVGKKVNDALVPTQLKNHPYPFVWVPPEYANNRKLKNPVTEEVSEQDKISHDRKPPGPVRADAQEPRIWNGWLPFGMNSSANVINNGDGSRNRNGQMENNRRGSEDGIIEQNQQSQTKRAEFPFPIIWMPYYNNQEEGGRKNNQESSFTPKSIEEVPQSSKSVPVNICSGEVATNGTRSRDESTDASGSDVTEKVTNQKCIPVRQIELHQGENDSEGGNRRGRNIPVKQIEENMIKKDTHASVKRQSMSPRKASNLSPVCLRVDPLLKKKNGKGNSRSPSPPASKEHSQATARETSGTTPCGMNDKALPDSELQNALNISVEVKPRERTVLASENKTSESKGAESRDRSHCQVTSNMPSGVSTGTKESCANVDKYQIEENKTEKEAESILKEEVTEPGEAKSSSKTNGKVLSDVDAAVLIQAAYRGFQVRKWEPLKKLKQIAEIRKEVTDVSGRIQALEVFSDLQNDDKQSIIIGETIMRLLLKLDTIQGLHSSFREIRKSLARELTSLQEKLDAIMAKKPQQQVQELFARKPQDAPLNTQNGEHLQEHQERKATPGEDSSEGINHRSHDMLEKSEDQFPMKDGIHSFPADDGKTESQSPVDPASNSITDPVDGIVNEDVNQVVTVDACNSAIGLSETDKVAVEHETKSEVEVDRSDITAWEELPVGVIDGDLIDIYTGKDAQKGIGRVEAQLTGYMVDGNFLATVDESARDGLDSEIHAMEQLPVGLLDEDTATSEFENHDETKMANGVLQAGDKECIAELPVGLLDEDTATSEFERHDATEISEGVGGADGEFMGELPLELLDEDMAAPEIEKHDESKSSEEFLPAGEGECNANVKISSSTDDTTKETQLEGQQLEEKDEVQSSGESDGWVKIEFQKEDEVDIKVEYHPGEELGNDTRLPSLTTKATEVVNGDVGYDGNNIQQEREECGTNTQPHVPTINGLQKEEKPEEKGIIAEQAVSADANETETLTKDKNEQSAAASPAHKELPVSEHDGELNGDTKLLEENDKLRNMMKKLLEAGNEQLSVISDLTGRVKDLEKKLARSKRVRTKPYRPATSMMRVN